MKFEFKIKFDTSKKDKGEKKASLSDLKEKAEKAINSAKEKAEEVVNEVSEKAAPKVKEAQEYAEKAKEKAEPVLNEAKGRAKDFFDKMIDFAEKTAEKVEDYIDQKLAEEKDASPDDITEEFFESDVEEEIETEESDEEGTETEEPEAEEAVEEETDAEEAVEEETDAEEAVEEETETEEAVEEETETGEAKTEDTFQSDVNTKRKANTISLEEFLDEIVGFEQSDEKPDISEETESFLWAIEYCASDVSKAAFKVAVKLPKITYACVINAIEKDFPEMTKTEIRKQLQADFKNWVNLRHPDVKEDCPNANSITLMKCWAKKFNKF